MRHALHLVLFGLAAMIGPMLGTSLPWAPTVHALVLGDVAWEWWPGAPHVAPAYLAMVAGTMVAWVGSIWFLVLAALHERMFEEQRALERERARW